MRKDTSRCLLASQLTNKIVSKLHINISGYYCLLLLWMINDNVRRYSLLRGFVSVITARTLYSYAKRYHQFPLKSGRQTRARDHNNKCWWYRESVIEEILINRGNSQKQRHVDYVYIYNTFNVVVMAVLAFTIAQTARSTYRSTSYLKGSCRWSLPKMLVRKRQQLLTSLQGNTDEIFIPTAVLVLTETIPYYCHRLSY